MRPAGLRMLLCSVVFLGAVGVGHPSAAAPGLFSTVETRNDNLAPFPKWTGVLDKFFNAQTNQACRPGAFENCAFAKWGKMLTKAQNQKPMQQLVTVNKFMNNHKYIVDPINWGVEDYWAIPDEFLSRFGDCEDYSIAKYMSLRALGWKPEDMRVVVLQDMNLRAMHAVLAVKFKGKEYILDNQISLVVEHTRIHHYKPIFSVSENGWWRHKAASSVSGGTKKTLTKKPVIKRKVMKKKIIPKKVVPR